MPGMGKDDWSPALARRLNLLHQEVTTSDRTGLRLRAGVFSLTRASLNSIPQLVSIAFGYFPATAMRIGWAAAANGEPGTLTSAPPDGSKVKPKIWGTLLFCT